MEVDRIERENINPGEEQYVQEKILATPEGRILMAGLVLSFLGISCLALSWLWMPDKSHVLAVMTATNIIFGRAAGMSVGYSMGLDHIMVIPVNMLVETILVLLFYPLFVFSWRRLLVIQALRNFMERTGRAAETQRATIRRYGIIGLFVFVWSPFWMTGPVAGCAIGFLLGLKPWLNLTIVLAGTYLAITCWAILLREIYDRIAMYSSFAPIILVVILILIIFGGRLLHRLHRKNNSRIM
jgi:uncharacterized membrane protein